MSPNIQVKIVLASLHAHLVEVAIRVPLESITTQLDFAMPSWSPGSYLMREYGRHVRDVCAVDAGGDPVALSKVDKGTWRVELPAPTEFVVLSYAVYCRDLNVRGSLVDERFAFLHGPSLLMGVVGHAAVALEIEVAGAPDHWSVSTTLSGHNGHYTAAGYDELVDHPIVVSPFRPSVEFEVDGVAHEVLLLGHERVPERLGADLRKIVSTAAAVFGGPLPYPRYTFIVLGSGNLRGGLEHRASTALIYPSHKLNTPRGYEDFLQLCSHEFFHVWNVKRIRPAALAPPFDYTREAYTRTLWAMEGVTVYYQSLVMVRAGVMEVPRLLEILGDNYSALQKVPGRAVHSLEESSFDAWIKLYRPDDNTPNTTVSYYLKGGLVACLLDLELRARTGGAKSLDDVLRELWARFLEGGGGFGFGEGEYAEVVAAVLGESLDAFFAEYVASTAPIPLAESLARFGVSLTPKPAKPDTEARSWIGADTKSSADRVSIKSVRPGGPTERAGLSPDDELVAIDGVKVDTGTLEALLESYKAGESAVIHVFRAGELVERTLVFAEAPVEDWVASVSEPANAEQVALREGWLGA